jgi:hypothetical protein
MQFIQFTACRADTGAVLPYAKAYVYLAGTTTLATLFDVGGAPLGINPVIAGAGGALGFAAANGLCDIQITSADGSYSVPKILSVQFYDMSQLDGKIAALLDASGHLASSALPTWVSTTAARNSSTMVAKIQRRTAKSRVLKAQFNTSEMTLNQFAADADVNGDGGVYSNLLASQPFISASWLHTASQPGIPVSSFVQRIRIPASLTVGSGGGTIQAWLMRPATPLAGVASGSTLSLTWIADLCEYSVPAGAWPTDLVLEIPVAKQFALAGDLIVLRGVNVGMPLSSASTSYTNDYYIRITNIADLTMSAVHGGLTTNVGSGARVVMQVDIAPGPIVSDGQGPSSLLALDAAGYIPAHISRKADLPWLDQIVIVTGTSQEIRDAVDAPTPSRNHVYQMFEGMQCLGFNEGLGSSRVVFADTVSTDQLSLGGTKTEIYNLAIRLGATVSQANAAALYSYEAKVIDRLNLNPGQRIFWIDLHGFNDAGPSTIGTITDSTPTTYYGAKRRMYDAFYAACRANSCTPRLMLSTVTHPYNADGSVNATRAAINDANRALAAFYGAPFFDLMAVTGVGPTTIQVGAFSGGIYAAGILSDGVHIRQAAYDNIAPAFIAAVRAA